MNTIKKLISFTMLIPLSFILLTGCHLSSPSASEVAQGYYSLLIKQDPSPMLSLEIMNEETVYELLSNTSQNLKAQIATGLSMEGRITLSNEQIDTIEKAYFDLLSRLECTITSQKKRDQYIVTISSQCIDFSSITEEATQLALNDVNISKYAHHTDYLSHLSQAYIPHLVQGYAQATPLDITQEASFTFTKQHGLWLPSDYEAFLSGLCNLIEYTPSKNSSTSS